MPHAPSSPVDGASVPEWAQPPHIGSRPVFLGLLFLLLLLQLGVELYGRHYEPTTNVLLDSEANVRQLQLQDADHALIAKAASVRAGGRVPPQSGGSALTRDAPAVRQCGRAAGASRGSSRGSSRCGSDLDVQMTSPHERAAGYSPHEALPAGAVGGREREAASPCALGRRYGSSL